MHSTCQNKPFFHTSDYLHSADSLKNIFEIPPVFNSQFSGGSTRKLRVFFLHTNCTLEVKNRVQSVWAKREEAQRVEFSKEDYVRTLAENRPGVNLVPRTGASGAAERIR